MYVYQTQSVGKFAKKVMLFDWASFNVSEAYLLCQAEKARFLRSQNEGFEETMKIASTLESFLATVIMSSAWPDLSKFQSLGLGMTWPRLEPRQTTTYQTWSEGSNH